MKTKTSILAFLLLTFVIAFASAAEGKAAIYAEADALTPKLVEIADFIHANPELGNKEFKAVDLLSKTLASNGFTIEMGVAGLETAFIATYKNAGGGPAMAFLAEYDALEGLGHACGHNVIAASCTGAAIALSKSLGKTPATVIVFGCPAEETTSGKIPMAKEGLFKRADVGFQMHPGSGKTKIGSLTLALNLIDFEFDGKSSHAASSPEKGRSALDGVMMMFNGVEYLREHVKSDIRIHGIVTKGGDAANIVPEKAAARFYVRGLERPYLNSVVERVYKVAKGAAMATETNVTIKEIKQYDNVVNVPSLMSLAAENTKAVGITDVSVLGPGEAPGGSTDFGTASSQIPCLMFALPTAPAGVPGHSRDYAAANKTPAARAAVVQAAKIMAASAYDLIVDPKLLTKVKEDWKATVAGN